jgi:hypothetical protein
MEQPAFKLPKRSSSPDHLGMYDYHGPIFDHFGFPRWKKTPVVRDGIAFIEEHIDTWLVRAQWACQKEKILMNFIEELKKDYDAAADMWAQYEKKLDQFRSAVKNDVASLEATARRAHDSAIRIQKAHADVFAQLNGAEMQTAIANAERLATALQAIHDLKAHRVTLSVAEAG